MVVVNLTCVKIVARNCGLLAVDVNDGGPGGGGLKLWLGIG